MTTHITVRPFGLYVNVNGYEYRRVDDRWQMLGSSGQWFDNDPQSDTLRCVADYENCLRSYAWNEGPDYPKGRKFSESISDFIKRKQTVELRAGIKDLFAPVATKYYYRRPSNTRKLLNPYSDSFRKHLTK